MKQGNASPASLQKYIALGCITYSKKNKTSLKRKKDEDVLMEAEKMFISYSSGKGLQIDHEFYAKINRLDN